MLESLKKILSEDEQTKLADKGITLLPDDVLELVSGGSGDESVKKGYSTIVYQSVIRSSMMSYMSVE